jgi:hypothetical protein
MGIDALLRFCEVGETVSVISDWMLFHCFLPHFEIILAA